MFLAIFLFLETTVFIPTHAALFLLVFVCVYRRQEIESKAKLLHLQLIGGLIVFSIINCLFHLEQITELKEVIPYTVFFILTYFVCLLIDARFIYIFCLLICFEVIVGIGEYSSGVITFFPDLIDAELKEFSDSKMLYFKRVYGLSDNSSGLGAKCLLLFVLSQFLQSNKLKWLCVFLGVIGLLITFSRTAMVASIAFLVVMTWHNKKILYSYCVIGGAVAFYFVDTILSQFFRGRDSIDLSARDIIWPQFFQFFQDNPLLGYGGFKYYIAHGGSDTVHAHNSYLMILASQGLIFFSLLCVIFFLNVNKYNFKLLVPIMVYAFYQTAIFWGISLFDIILYFLLFRLRCHHQEYFKIASGAFKVKKAYNLK